MRPHAQTVIEKKSNSLSAGGGGSAYTDINAVGVTVNGLNDHSRAEINYDEEGGAPA